MKIPANGVALSLLTIAAVSAAPAFAYVGPGVGLGAIGAILAMIGGLFMVILGLVWYPFKVMLRKRREARVDATVAKTEQPGASQLSGEDPPAQP